MIKSIVVVAEVRNLLCSKPATIYHSSLCVRYGLSVGVRTALGALVNRRRLVVTVVGIPFSIALTPPTRNVETFLTSPKDVYTTIHFRNLVPIPLHTHPSRSVQSHPTWHILYFQTTYKVTIGRPMGSTYPISNVKFGNLLHDT